MWPGRGTGWGGLQSFPGIYYILPRLVTGAQCQFGGSSDLNWRGLATFSKSEPHPETPKSTVWVGHPNRGFYRKLRPSLPGIQLGFDSPTRFRVLVAGKSKKSDPIESQRKNLSGSWHSGRSQHEQYLGHAGSSVRDLPHRRHSKIFTHEPLQRGSRSLQASKTSMRSFVSRYVQRHSTPAEIPT